MVQLERDHLTSEGPLDDFVCAGLFLFIIILFYFYKYASGALKKKKKEKKISQPRPARPPMILKRG